MSSAVLAATAIAARAAAPDRLDYARVVPLLSTSQRIVGETLAYPPPGAPAKISSAIVTLAPGESTGAHKHGVPTYGYILSGSVTVDYGNHGRRVYEAGTAFMEGMDVWHDGVNEADVPCRMGQPAEVASAVYRLCTANLRYVTGTEIFVTGGQHLY